ncbi:MAG: CHAP domain-containing protein [Candidatus Saccharibacteria bacterium]
MNKVSFRSLSHSVKIGILSITSIVLVGATMISGVKTVLADATCGTISDCTAQINTNNNAVAQLRTEAASFQDAINHLNAQIGQLQSAIDSSTTQQSNLQDQIVAAQKEIARQKAILSSDIKTMYVDGTPTTIEVLATSRNLSEFVDKQEYRTVVQNKLQETLKTIATLQAQLQSQKVEIDALLVRQNSQKAELATAYSQQANLLSYNEGQQSNYNSQTAANQGKLNALIEAQRRANNSTTSGGYYFIRFPGSAGGFDPGNYSYANAGFGMSTAPGCVDNDGPDRWGYCTRQCVSYVAWAVEASGRSAPMNYGDAKSWVGEARARGLLVSSPQHGDVAISTAGTWGHAMYVESVSGNQIFVSQYNAQLTGRFSTQWRTYQ